MAHTEMEGKITPLEFRKSAPQDGFEGYFLYRGGNIITELSGPQTDARTADLQSIIDAANAYPDLVAENERLRSRMEILESFLGLQERSRMEQIARDIKLGVFPKMSEQTKAEIAVEDALSDIIKTSIQKGAPKLSEITCGAIANSIGVKIRAALTEKAK